MKWIDKPFVIGADGVKLISSEHKGISDRFIFHFLKSRIHTIPDGYARHFSKLKEIRIPIIPLEKQREIVEILDKFEALTQSISSGLPAEIAARRKQYEYYRAKLLDFKPRA